MSRDDASSKPVMGPMVEDPQVQLQAPTVPESPPITSYRRVATRGMAWVVGHATYAKLASFLAQWVLGLLLADNDYFLWGVAISVSALVSALRDAGLYKILIQRGKKYHELAAPVLQMALMFNGVCALLLVIAAPLAARFYDAPGLPPLLWISAATTMLATPAMVFQAKLLIDLRFGKSMRIAAVSSLLMYTGQIVLALLHFGPMSFALPSAFVAIFECIAYGMAAGFLPNRNRLTLSLFKDLFGASAWIMAGALATTLINNGDYLIIGRMQPSTLATYFFGCQLSIGFAVIFAVGIRSVLMPILAQFSDQPERFGNAYLRSLRTFAFVFIPLCVLAAIATPPFVHLFWRGKWDKATPVVVIMTFALAFRLLTPVALAGMEARGNWTLQTVLLFIDGVGTIVAALIGCLIGGLFEITICVAINRSVMALLQCAVVGRKAGLKHRSILREVMPPIAIGAASAIASYLTYLALGQGHGQWVTAVVLGSLFVALFLVGSRLITPHRLRESIQLFKHAPGLRRAT